MPPSVRKLRGPFVREFLVLLLLSAGIFLPNVTRRESAQAQESAGPPRPSETQPQNPQSQTPQPQASTAPVSNYDKAIFQKPIPADQLAFLNQFSGVAAKDVMRDKQFRKLMKTFVPDCIFHYGRDMPLSDALDIVFKDSTLQVLIRDGRYLSISGLNGPYLAGRGFLWIDMQEGIGLGGFYFHPTNGEPTPSLVIFSRQVVKQDSLGLSQLPPAFADDLIQWSTESRVPPVTTRYFITGSNKRILLEHDEEFCSKADGTSASPDSGCVLMDADAADADMTAASYLDQTHHATNATAWMINDPDQIAWLQVRNNTCSAGPDPLRCHIRMTRERTAVIINRSPMPHPPHR